MRYSLSREGDGADHLRYLDFLARERRGADTWRHNRHRWLPGFQVPRGRPSTAASRWRPSRHELWSGRGKQIRSRRAPSSLNQSAEVRGYGVKATGNADSGSGQPAAILGLRRFQSRLEPSLDHQSGAVRRQLFRSPAKQRVPPIRIPLAVAPVRAASLRSPGVQQRRRRNGYYGTSVTLDGTSSILPCRPGAEFGDTDLRLASAFCLDEAAAAVAKRNSSAAGARGVSHGNPNRSRRSFWNPWAA